MAINANVISFPPSIDTYVETLISTTARKSVRNGSVSKDDREDLEQDLRLAVLSSIRGFDPMESSWHTYANGVVHRAIKMRMRGHLAACRNPNRCRTLINDSEINNASCCMSIADIRLIDEEHQIEHGEEIRAVVDRLPRDQRTLANLLMNLEPGAACRQLGWTRDRYYQNRARIRRALEKSELVPV
jgi:RNA polymerase sigma factor (sigma-70 family)